MTLLVLPLALLWNGFIFRTQRLMFKSQDLRVRRNGLVFFTYVIGYSMVLQPICVWGSLSELAGLRNNWGRKYTGSTRSARRSCLSPYRPPTQAHTTQAECGGSFHVEPDDRAWEDTTH